MEDVTVPAAEITTLLPPPTTDRWEYTITSSKTTSIFYDGNGGTDIRGQIIV
jgi:hypothetical protein